MKRTGVENPDHKPSDKEYARYGGMASAYNKGKGYETKMGFAGKKNKDEKGSKIGRDRRDATTPKGVKTQRSILVLVGSCYWSRLDRTTIKTS